MGLDAVELVMECEQVFGVSISDEDAGRCETAGDLLKVLVNLQARRRGPTTLHPGTAFFRLRIGLRACGIGGGHRLLPTDRLDDLLPSQQRRALWQQLSAATGFILPRLMPGRNLERVAAGAISAISVALGWVLLGWPGVYLGLVLAFVLIVGMYLWVFPRLPGEFPDGCHTVGDLAERAAARNHGLNERETWRILRSIISEELGVPEDDIKPESHFVKDLNVG